ncbi:hypothetical protein B0I35DRAFT_415218 [Stachybotrys elegans]|uniref:Uncharacterized protein n=1 Tax=Stachybotrys elegans TaxID=80388 RepID=A0A8K0WIY0_9HYPO|nr:hypothetical protein B0I35DRAFT_415218 [Stachybotrys elegans]
MPRRLCLIYFRHIRLYCSLIRLFCTLRLTLTNMCRHCWLASLPFIICDFIKLIKVSKSSFYHCPLQSKEVLEETVIFGLCVLPKLYWLQRTKLYMLQKIKSLT